MGFRKYLVVVIIRVIVVRCCVCLELGVLGCGFGVGCGI